MAKRKPGRGGGERGGRGGARAALPRQRRVPAKGTRPVAVTARSPGRVSAPPFNPRAAAGGGGGGGNNNSQPPAARRQRRRRQPARASAILPPGERVPSSSCAPPPQPPRPRAPPLPPAPPSVPGAARRGRPGGQGRGEPRSSAPAPAPPPRRPLALPGAGGEKGRAVRVYYRKGGRAVAEDVGGVGGKAVAAGGRLKGAFCARCRRAEGYDARAGGGAAVGEKAAAAALEVPEFQRRRNGKPAKPKCPRGARPRWGGLALPPALRSPRLPRSPARSLGACQRPRGAAGGFGICARQPGLTNLLPSRSDGQEQECCHREDERGMVMPATYG
ncbi:cuticle collagen 2C-like [Pseudopipra pipra]|uniref:cuticle collagen 2C-like n=1 Tax=Pseudopipra pipra TaxID=415032 RepID=UPI003139EF2D